MLHYDLMPGDADPTHYETLAEVLRGSTRKASPCRRCSSATPTDASSSRLGIQTYGFRPMQLPDDLVFRPDPCRRRAHAGGHARPRRGRDPRGRAPHRGVTLLSRKLGAAGTEVVVLFTTSREELERRVEALKATLAPADGLCGRVAEEGVKIETDLTFDEGSASTAGPGRQQVRCGGRRLACVRFVYWLRDRLWGIEDRAVAKVYETATLSNGIRVLTAPIPHAQSVSCFLRMAAPPRATRRARRIASRTSPSTCSSRAPTAARARATSR